MDWVYQLYSTCSTSTELLPRDDKELHKKVGNRLRSRAIFAAIRSIGAGEKLDLPN